MSGNRHWLNERFGNSHGDAVLNTLVKIAERRDNSPAQVALAWVLQKPQVTAALVSPASIGDLRDLLQSTAIGLTENETGALGRVPTMHDRRMDLRHA